MVDGITDSMDVSLSKLRKMVKDRKPGVLQSMRLPRVGHSLETERQQRTTINKQMYSTSEVLKFIELRQ